MGMPKVRAGPAAHRMLEVAQVIIHVLSLWQSIYLKQLQLTVT